MDEIVFIFLILIIIWYWWDTQQCNEIALHVCQRKCAGAGVQLLDSTVTRQRVWIRRSQNGWLQICRLYSFEFSGHTASEYQDRDHGYIVLIGKQVVETSLPDSVVDINVDRRQH